MIRQRVGTMLIALAGAFAGHAAAHADTILYVDPNANGAETGLDWFNAFTEVQQALVVAAGSDDANIEIRVAQGTYRPDRGGGEIGDRLETFRLHNGVALRGGYAGILSDDPGARDILAFESILTGDLNLDDDTIGASDNAYHVVTVHGVDASAILDGFTIRGGNADGTAPDDHGAGLIGTNGSPTVSNCRLADHNADGDGAAAHLDGGTAAFENCIFRGNNAAGAGAALAAVNGAAPTLTNCTIAANVGGAAVSTDVSSTLTIVNSTIWNNTGGAFAGAGTPSVTFSDIEGSFGGVGNINSDPQFADADGRLGPFSLCRDAGNNSAANLPALDLDLRPRVSNTTVDMGAFEFQDCNNNDVEDSGETDSDGDGVIDICDSCAQIPNPDQGIICCTGGSDSDGDGVINACEQPAGVICVSAAATGTADGSDWINAYPNLQDALDAAEAAAGAITEIRIARGTFRPDVGASVTAEERTETFHMLNGVTINGGYAGIPVPSADPRDIVEHLTILSGDLLGDDYNSETEDAENSYRVVTAGEGIPDPPVPGFSPIDASAILDGVTITGGNADGLDSTTDRGAGIYNKQGAPTIRRCIITRNSAGAYAGGMYNNEGNAFILGSTFAGNNAGLFGGGVFNRTDSDATFVNCAFIGNSANRGGGLYNQSGSDPEVTNCLFLGNTVADDGGAMYNTGSAPHITNSTFTRNESGDEAGGVYNYDGSPFFLNCIMWNNPGNSFGGAGTPFVSYCDVDGGFIGAGNFSADPQFFNASAADLRLMDGSPCIDAGVNGAVPFDTLDLDGDGDTAEPTPYDYNGNYRFIDVLSALDIGQGTPPLVDMGAFEHFVPADVFNITRGRYHDTIAEAFAFASDGDAIEAAATRFVAEITIDFGDLAVTLSSVGGIAQPAGAVLTLANDATLAAATGQTVSIGGEIRLPVGDHADVRAALLTIAPTGLATIEPAAVLDVQAPATVDGVLDVDSLAIAAFLGPFANNGTLTLNGGSLNAPSLTNSDAIDLFAGEIQAMTLVNSGGATLGGYGDLFTNVTNDGDATFVANTQVVGDYTNNGDTTVQSGTLTITGSLTNNGTITGDVSSFRAPGGLTVTGHYSAAAGATLKLPGTTLTFKLGGDFDVAIDNYENYDMVDATLQAAGLNNAAQVFEVMCRDIGTNSAGLVRAAPGRFPIGTLRIGPAATTVDLVDSHDNDSLGQATPEVIYVSNLIIDSGATLNTNDKIIYALTITNNGSVDDPGNLILLGVPLGDSNNDGVIDLVDYAALNDCFAGPGGGYVQPICQVFDYDFNGSINLFDFARFQADFEGPAN